MKRTIGWRTGAGTAIAALALGVSFPAVGAEAADAKTGLELGPKEAAMAMRMGATLNVFRLGAASNVEETIRKWGGKDCLAKWEKQVSPHFTADEKIELHDFFSSAVVWIGSVEGDRAVAGLYSLWSDGLLLVTLKEAGTNSVVEDFQFICGESWRGQTTPSADEAVALYQLTEPLTLAAARLYGPSVERFKRHYPAAAKVELLPESVRGLIQPMEAELLMIKARMMVRMQMYQKYFAADSRQAVVAASMLIKKIREGDREKLKASLAPEQTGDMIDSICLLPAGVRNNLAPNYFGKGSDGMVLGLVNPAAPRWLIAAQVKKGAKTENNVVVELFDLELSEKVLRLSKEVKP